MASDSNCLWIIAAPESNFNEIATVNVCSHEVPIPAYWRIVQLYTDGKTEDEIVQEVIQYTGIETLRVVAEVVSSILDNQRRILSTTTAQPSRFSLAVRKPKNVSAYRAARIEARQDLRAAEARLHAAKSHEKHLLTDAMILSRAKEQLDREDVDLCTRQRRLSAVEERMKHVLEEHKDVEAEIEYAKRLTIIHRASLA
ncbi:hypothetical protein PV08_05326 [Exophiala spinifera]|uniref:Uncharacterized protein n=1 Tax=Exophiala spinifera TaxID=91928 RepID=A0A0D1YJX1_9EURO|nr:uncharacterized protein PV08_05326 [Exophiala spinifera]KIW15281.1 hypothetical protein PV08_05326 [Exophiala spinifera]